MGARLIFVGVVAGAHAILFTDLPLVVRAAAALVIVAVAPGALLAAWLLPRDEGNGQAVLERVVISAALACTTLTVGMLLLSYLPGGVARWQVLLAFDVAMAALGIGVWAARGGDGETRRQGDKETRRQGDREKARGEDNLQSPISQSPISQSPISQSHNLPISKRWVIAGALILLVIGAAVRLPGLGYAEFHGDEARAVLRAAAVIQGDEEALLIHRKGPVEIVAPAALFALTGQIDEASARLPFALAGLAALLAVWALGWRLIHAGVGWLAALLLAVTGYYVAFSRFLQYQSVVILTTAAALLAVAWLVHDPRAPRRRLLLAALLFATGLLAHYDALAAAPPLLMLAGAAYLRWREDRRALLAGAVIATAAGASLLALYYAPFLLNPAFRATVDYLLEDRIGGSPPYNNLGDLLVRGAVYNSAYLLLLLAGLSLIGLLAVFWRGYGRRWGAMLGAVALLATAALVLNRGVLVAGGRDITVLPVAALLLLACCAPRLDVGRRTVWLWFATAFVLYVFLTARPRTHVHVFFAPWALIAGYGLVTIWRAATRRAPRPTALAIAAAGAGALTLIFGFYVQQLYVRNDVEVLRTWPAFAPAGFWMPGDVEAVDGRFGFPFANGWKVAGALYAQGIISGDYETNQRYNWVPDWYTRGQLRCGSTAEWYFAVNSLEPWMEDQTQIAGRLAEQGFAPWGVVTIAGDERMTIYRAGGASPPEALRRLAVEEFAPGFDAGATASLPLAYPAVLESPRHKLDITFGDEIRLEGYDLLPESPLRPGQSFRLKLYWRAIAPSTGSHKVSVQSYYGDGVMVAQKDALPVCDREPTTTWQIGERVVDIHDVPVAADAPPGSYPLFVSLYREEGGALLPIHDAAGALVGDALQLGEIEIQE